MANIMIVAMLYKIPRIWLDSNPMCGAHVYTIHNFLLGPHNTTLLEPSSLLVDVPYYDNDDDGRTKNLFRNRSLFRLPESFPNLTFVNETEGNDDNKKRTRFVHAICQRKQRREGLRKG